MRLTNATNTAAELQTASNAFFPATLGGQTPANFPSFGVHPTVLKMDRDKATNRIRLVWAEAPLLRPVGDKPHSLNSTEAREAPCSILFQDADEQLFMPTVLEDVAFGPLNLGLSEQDARQRAERMLARVGMSHVAGKAPYHLSAGEKRRVALAGVLAMEPEILILDEPTTFLDPPGQRELVELLRSLPQAKLLVTHDIPFAMSLASRAVFFDKGRITEDGPLRDVVRNRHWQASAE